MSLSRHSGYKQFLQSWSALVLCRLAQCVWKCPGSESITSSMPLSIVEPLLTTHLLLADLDPLCSTSHRRKTRTIRFLPSFGRSSRLHALRHALQNRQRHLLQLDHLLYDQLEKGTGQLLLLLLCQLLGHSRHVHVLPIASRALKDVGTGAHACRWIDLGFGPVYRFRLASDLVSQHIRGPRVADYR